VTVTVAEADLVESAWLVAVMVTVVLTETVGALNSPELETAPTVADKRPLCSRFRLLSR